MRSTFAEATVRLYHLDGEVGGAGATTLFYGALSQAVALAAAQDEGVQDGLFLATDNDVIAWRDFAGEDDDT